MRIIVTLGNNTLDVDGEFTLDGPFSALLRTWINAALPNNDAVTLEELTERLKAANDALASTVAAHSK